MKLVFECEVDMAPGKKIRAIELLVQREGEVVWNQELAFVFSRPQTVREGKRIRLSQSEATVITVGT